MNFAKGGIDGQVNKVIDQAAMVAKQKIGEAIGGDKPQNKQGKDAGIDQMVTGVIAKAAANQAADKAAKQALDFGKNLLG